MKKGDKEWGIWSAIAILVVVVSAFSGAVSAENVSEDLKGSVAYAGSQSKDNITPDEQYRDYQFAKQIDA